jgi:hypothetical protein
MLIRTPSSGELVGHLNFLLSGFDMTASYANGEGMFVRAEWLCRLLGAIDFGMIRGITVSRQAP